MNLKKTKIGLPFMITTTHLRRMGILVLLSSLFCLQATAQTSLKSADSVTIKDGLTQAKSEGKWIPLEEELELASAIKVQTNGTFTVDGGKPRRLSEGQVLRKDGYLLNPDGTMAPVYDRLTVEKIGVVMLYQNGAGRRLTQPYTLPDGSRVSPDGTMVLSNGKLKRLVPGQMFKLNGDVLGAKDSITMNNGTVFVQKEGKQYKIEANRSFTMNDGTKVFGSGRIVKMDGSESFIREGEIVTVPGVTVK